MRREKGSALIIAVLVMVILTLLGVSFLLMAETENRIAENERLAAQALYFTEAATRAVIQWFDHPGSPTNVIAWDPAAADRTLRQIDDDGNPSTPPQDGAAWPRYKQGVDRNVDGQDDLFEKPYRFVPPSTPPYYVHTLLGTEDGPDVRMDGEVPGPARDFLDRLSEALLSGYPAVDGTLRARISRIDIYAPPYIEVAGQWTRFGIATVKVTGRIYRGAQDSGQILSERMVKAVLNEIPYSIPYGPMHSCRDFSLLNELSFHWGTVTSVGIANLSDDHADIPAGLPRLIPPGVRIDLLWATYDNRWFDEYKNVMEGEPVQDPWFRFIAGGEMPNLNPARGSQQPYPFLWEPAFPPDPPIPPNEEQYPNHRFPARFGDHSNLFQNLPLVDCPELDYDLFKSIATAGTKGVQYYKWDSGTSFQRDGVGPSRSFEEITDADPVDPATSSAVFFFDTKDGLAPHDDDGDGLFDNLTPDISVSGTWAARGFIYLNARSVRIAAAGRSATIRAPGEPFQDSKQNGRYDPIEGWVNLSYPASLGGPFQADLRDPLQEDGAPPGPPARNSQGPPFDHPDVALSGILYTSGRYDASGTATHYGSIVAKEGVYQSSPAAGNPDVYFDESISTGIWPPRAWNLPRVTVTRWETDL